MRHRVRGSGVWLALWLLLQTAAAGAANTLATDHVQVRLVAERTALVPGDQVDLALAFEIRPGWHTYWRNPGDSGAAPVLRWTLPAGARLGPVQWPYPERIPVGPFANYGYSGQAAYLATLDLAEDWPAGEPLRLQLEAEWLVCEETCIPESGALALTLATTTLPESMDWHAAPTFAAARARLPRPVALTDARLSWAPPDDTTAARRLRLSLPQHADWGEPRAVEFFAAAWGLIEHAAPQSWQVVGERLLLELTPGATPLQVEPAGLLVVTALDGQTHAHEVKARWAETPLDRADTEGGGTALTLPLALLLALLGGILLNLMPCVFPVLAIKVLSLVQGAAGNRRRRIGHALAYTLGVLTFFALLGILLLALRAAGETIGWGFQLQYPPFVALMAYLFLAIGLSLSGAIALGDRLMGLAATLDTGAPHRSHGALGAFLTGALAALVAAPCTAPFMGAALGYALTLTWPWALGLILTLGLGLALPFLLLALWPRWVRALPRAGEWMRTLKEVLAFPMYGAAIWLVWVTSVQAGPGGVATVLSGMLALVFALWLAERPRAASRRLAWTQRLLIAAALLGAILMALRIVPDGTDHPVTRTEPASGDWTLAAEPFSPARLAQARQADEPVFVNMTAAWCITCLVNERVALHTERVSQAFSERGIRYLKGDWTARDPAITAYLADFGRGGVPLYVYYPPGAPPRVLPQVLTAGIVIGTLESAADADPR